MPITFDPIEHAEGHWHGKVWTVDEAVLARHVAHVALGGYLYVRKVLHELEGKGPVGGPLPDAETVAGAKQMLTVEKASNPYHRDGWLFQTLSWITARLDENPGLTLSQPPHPLHAHKGLDALEIVLGADPGTVERIVVGEDKAVETGRARPTVLKVWKEIETGVKGEIEDRGKRRNLIRQGIASLLDERLELDEITVIDEFVWRTGPAYRVAITDGEAGTPSDRATKIFTGFEDIVSGDVHCRQVALLHVDDLRPWMEALAQRARDHLDSLVP